MSRPIRLARALGAAGITVLVVTVGSTAAAPGAVADPPPPGIVAGAPHGDPLPAATLWSAAGRSFAVPAALPPAGCVEYRASDDLANEVALGGPRWHMVVAVPADVAQTANYNRGGREALYAEAVQSVVTLDHYYRARVGNGDVGQTALDWTLRWDYGTSCGAQFPDVSIYHLPRTQAEYTSEPFFGIVADLDASGLYERADRRYVVHYAGDSIYCGQSYIYAPGDSSGGAKYSITYNHHLLGTLDGASLCDWTTDAHEMGHSVGAATGGPMNNDGAHTWDCSNDVMSYGGPVCGDGALYFDWRENNYFGHTGTWNDTDQSAYWCKPTC